MKEEAEAQAKATKGALARGKKVFGAGFPAALRCSPVRV
jgi:hypothetical protein